MGVTDKLRAFFGAELRAFNPGTVAVDSSALTFGVDPEQWAPSEYGSYIATSTPVYTVVKKRATYLSSLPLTLSRLKADGSADPITSGALYELTRKVNPYWTWRRLIEMTEMSLCLWGSAYWFLERGNGVPKEIYWARPDRVRVVPHATNYVARFEYQPQSGMEPIRFKPEETVWFRYPNPLDEYSGLSPLAGARLAADTQSAAMKQNYQLFKQGISLGGLVTPDGDRPMSKEAGKEIAEQLQHRAKGTANAHRWLVLLHAAKFEPMSMSPKDAEFIALHKLTLEDICRVYGVPIDLVGGQRTFENYQSAVVSMWADTIIPEAVFLADEITEQLLPMFAGGEKVDLVTFDTTEVAALKEDTQKVWLQARLALGGGGITLNQFQEAVGLPGFDEAGDVLYVSTATPPVRPADLSVLAEMAIAPPEPIEPPAIEEEPENDEAADEDESPETDPERALRPQNRVQARMEYGSDEHERLWQRFVARTEPHETKVARASRKLFRAQEQSILTELGKVERAAEPDDIDGLMGKIFSIQKWRKRFREGIRPVLRAIIADAGQDALDQVTVGVGFDLTDPLVARALFDQTQRFAVELNETTWNALKASLAEGLEAGEGTDLLAQRVRAVMGDRIRSSGETIARTETISAANTATEAGFRQSGVVEAKSWLASLDSRTRETHVAAHGQTVALDANFHVGGASGPAPGSMGKASEDVNCRCTILAVLKPLGDE